MFGSCFKIRPKAGKFNDLMALIEGERAARGNVPGFVRSYVLQASGGDVWVMAIFESEDAYRKNADSPDQDKTYHAMREMLEADPEWHDGTIIEQLPPA
jgi:heme-degrading monooxygenase HmoA